MGTGLSARRVLLLGAETEVGTAIAQALSEAGAPLAVVAATPAPQAAFAVQRLARRLGALAQAIDAANEMAVRVMVRQVAKQLGGLDAVVYCRGRVEPSNADAALPIQNHILRYGGRELDRAGGGPLVVVAEGKGIWIRGDEGALPQWWLVEVAYAGRKLEQVAKEVLREVRALRRGSRPQP